MPTVYVHLLPSAIPSPPLFTPCFCLFSEFSSLADGLDHFNSTRSSGRSQLSCRASGLDSYLA